MSNETDTTAVIDEEIKSLLAEVAREVDFREYKIERPDGSIKGDGNMGIITRMRIVGKNEKSETNILNLIVKSAPKNDAFRSEAPVVSAFGKEIYMYNTVFPTFRMFEIEKGLQPTCFAPKFYKSNITRKSEALVLENLNESGYELHEKKIPMDDSHVRLVMSQYGRLHALSFALRDQNPEKFEQVVACMDELFIKFLKEKFLDTVVLRCTKVLESLHTNTDQKAIKYLQNVIDELEPFLDELGGLVDDYSVALHADCWANNMLFKYEDSNNLPKPTEVCFIDFQYSKIGIPVIDLSYFIYACGSKEIINNLDYYMQVYYKSLCTHLRKLGSDPEKLFPYSVLQQQWKKFGKFGLIITSINLHVVLSEKDEMVDLNDITKSGGISNAFNNDISNVDEYNDRMRHIIVHLADNNFL